MAGSLVHTAAFVRLPVVATSPFLKVWKSDLSARRDRSDSMLSDTSLMGGNVVDR